MRLFFIIVISFFSHFGFATDYYISPAGNDNSGNGTAGSPWRSLYKATTAVTKRGDIIHVNAGLYTENKVCILAAGVSIEGEGNTSVIQGNLSDDWKAVIEARSPEGTNGNQYITKIKLDGQNLRAFWGIWITGRSNVTVSHCTIIDFKDRGVIFDGRNDNTQGPPEIYATGNSFHDNYVSNCAAYTTPNGVYGRGCLNIGGQEGMVIYNNSIIQDSRPDGYNGYPIKYSNDGYLKGIKIFNNIITKIPFKGKFGGDNGWDFSIELWNIQGGMEIYGNIIQGAVDLVNTTRGNYKYGIWFHDNSVSQKVLNDHYESGIVFEVSTESVIVENNRFDKLSGGIHFNTQEGTLLNDIAIRRNVFSNIGRGTGNGNNGSAININRGTLFGDELHYVLNGLTIEDNKISSAPGNAPLYGIEITGAANAKDILLRNNTIEGFQVSFLIANPAKVLDSIWLEGNILANNGNSNKPFFIIGRPGNFISKANTRNYGPARPKPGINIREQFIRPVYYELKEFSLISGIAFLTTLFGVWFAGRNKVYAFAFGISAILFCIISCLDQGQIILPFLYMCFIPVCIYGWVSWSKKDSRNRDKLRISTMSLREYRLYIVFFAFIFLTIYFALYLFDNNPETIIWADSILLAAVFTATLMIAGRKTEGWIWGVSLTLFAVFLFYAKNYIIASLCFGLLLFIEILGLYQWKKLIRVSSVVPIKTKVL